MYSLFLLYVVCSSSRTLPHLATDIPTYGTYSSSRTVCIIELWFHTRGVLHDRMLVFTFLSVLCSTSHTPLPGCASCASNNDHPSRKKEKPEQTIFWTCNPSSCQQKKQQHRQIVFVGCSLLDYKQHPPFFLS